MKYSDNQVVQLGDEVELWDGCHGVVVCSIDDDEYSEAYPKTEWEYLKSGVLIETDKVGLIHYIEPDEDLRLRKRAK
jgi:hypothetical protein